MKVVFIFLLNTLILLSANAGPNKWVGIERPSITFILGEDSTKEDQFYTLAKQYYLQDAAAKTDYFVDSCRSLIGIRNYLEHYLPAQAPAWGQINLVVHSNQWTGMSVPVVEGGERTTIDVLFNSIQENVFMPLDDCVVDSETVLDFKSCGLGENQDLLYAIEIAFGGFDESKPQVRSSKDFIYYEFDEHQQIRTKQLKPFYAFYKTAYKPADLKLVKQFQQRYPNVKIDWLQALKNKTPRFEGDLFYTKFNVPIEWNVQLNIPAERLQIISEFDKIEFVRGQESLMELLNKYTIPIEKFRWTIHVTEKEGKASVMIKGKATVVCVLQEL